MKQPGVYILKSKKEDWYYIGSTDDIERRFAQHDSGKAFATKSKRPFTLELFHPCDTITEARMLERKIKKLKRKDYIKKMIEDRKIRMGP